MAIESVSSATNAISQQQQFANTRQPEAAERPRDSENAERARASTQTAARRTAAADQQAQGVEREAQAKRQEQAKPVVNAQGQKTGTIINTTA